MLFAQEHTPSGAHGEEAMTDAMTMAREAGAQARSGAAKMAGDLSDQAKSMTAAAGESAAEMGRRARDQAGAAVSAARDVITQQGSRAGDYLTQNINEYPLTSLLIAGAIGYGLACLFRPR
jgi:hypothetical protein